MAILRSSIACSFLASWYSEFSLRSPHSRAVLMRSAISRRAGPSSSASSAFSASRPSGGVWSDMLPTVALGRSEIDDFEARHALAQRVGQHAAVAAARLGLQAQQRGARP